MIYTPEYISKVDLRYIDLILAQFIKIKDGEFNPAKKSHPNYNRFVEHIKIIIDAELSEGLGFYLEFSDDYERVYRKPFVGVLNYAAEVKTPLKETIKTTPIETTPADTTPTKTTKKEAWYMR